jgi:hypothetical protein
VVVAQPINQLGIVVLLLTSLLVLGMPFENQSIFHNRLILNPFTQLSKFIILVGGAFLM